MRYFAILKDSLREARDSWVLLGLFVLCTIVILNVATLSFEPLSAERTMRLFFTPAPNQGPTMFMALNNRKPEKVFSLIIGWRRLELEKVQLLRGEPDAPESDYALTVKLHPGGFRENPMFGGKAPSGEKKKVDPAKEREAYIALLKLLFEDAEAAGFIKVGGIEEIPPQEETEFQRFKITVQGTPQTHRIWATETSFLFGYASLNWILNDMPLAFRLYDVAKSLISFGSWIAVLLGIVVTAFFIPSMLRKGTVDLLLVKPISRPLLLFYKYLGGMTFMFLVTAYAVGGIWLALGIRSGFWANGLLLLIFSLTFFFAILYAVSTLVGVITRSVIMSILVTVVAYGILATIGVLNGVVVNLERTMKELEKRKEFNGAEHNPDKDLPDWLLGAMKVMKVVNAISPRTEDINSVNDLIIYSEFMGGGLGTMGKFDTGDHNWWLSLFVSTIWIGIFLGLASLWFYYKDY